MFQYHAINHNFKNVYHILSGRIMYKQKYLKFKTQYLCLQSQKFEIACKDGDEKTVVNLLDSVTEEIKNKGFRIACNNSKLSIVKLLINKNNDINVQDCLPSACKMSNVEIVKLLIDKGAEVNIPDKCGGFALLKACEKGHVEIVKLLIDKGAEVNIQHKYGYFALGKACGEGHVEIVELLIEKGADINLQCSGGFTALMYAIKYLEIVRLLINKNAKLKLRNKYGSTAMTLAYNDAPVDIVKFLIEHDNGVDFEANLESISNKYDFDNTSNKNDKIVDIIKFFEKTRNINSGENMFKAVLKFNFDACVMDGGIGTDLSLCVIFFCKYMKKTALKKVLNKYKLNGPNDINKKVVLFIKLLDSDSVDSELDLVEEVLKFNYITYLSSPTSYDKNIMRASIKFFVKYMHTNSEIKDFLNSDYICNNYFLEAFVTVIEMDKIKSVHETKKKDGLLHMDKEETYPIDPTRSQQWIDFQCTIEAKQLAKKIIEKTVHVPYKDFRDSCYGAFNEFLNRLSTDKITNFCFVLPSEMSAVNIEYKSNYWMILLFYDYIKYKTPKPQVKFKILILNKILTGTNKKIILPANAAFFKSVNVNVFVGIDDVSYSGGQLIIDYLPLFDSILRSKEPNTKVYMIIPFLSEHSISRMCKSRYLYIDRFCDVNDKHTMGNTCDVKDKHIGGTCKFCTVAEITFCNNFEIFFNKKKVLLHQTDIQLLTRRNLLFQKHFPNTRNEGNYNLDNYLYYFDHKIADYNSSLPSVYQAGIISGEGDARTTRHPTTPTLYNDKGETVNTEHCGTNKFFYYPLIKACAEKPVTLTDLGEVSKEDHEKLCVEPFYKKRTKNTQTR